LIIVKAIGGLGNQMFQYAYAKVLEQKGHKVKIDISSFDTYKLHGGYQLDKYDLDLETSTQEENKKLYVNNILSKILKKLGIDNSNLVKEQSLLFDKKLLDVEDNRYIDGYFQSEKYFTTIRSILLDQFVINKDLSNYTKEIEKDIVSSIVSCSIHIRRGDYVSNEKSNNTHGTCDIEYYKKSIELMDDKFNDIKYFIFSDDIEWVKKNLKMQNAIYIESEEKRIPHEDVYLMSLCSHNIIANSSFSWWGAWLNQNNNKIIISPKRWFNDAKMLEQSGDIVCKSWKRI
jgi:hypothetical protein